MKLPSGREISIDGLADLAEMFATEIFHQENTDEAEETITEWLRDSCFSLSGTEPPFNDDDIVAAMNVVRPVAEEISGELAAVLDKYTPLSGPSPIKEMIEKEVGNDPHD